MAFRVGWRAAGGVWFLLFKSFLLVLARLSFWRGDWALGPFCEVLSGSATREATRIYHIYK